MADAMAAARGLTGFSIGLGLTELVAPEWLGEVSGAPLAPALVRAYGIREIAAGILTALAPAAGLWSRVAGDALDIGTVGAKLRAGNRTRILVTLTMLLGVTAIDVWAASRASRRRRWF